jgi:predicted metal-dependent hydrolase
MSTDRSRIDVSGIAVEVVRKEIKNLHVGVYPPDGRVRVAAPLRVDDENVRLAVVDKLGWIRRKRNELRSQARQSKREMVTGESHYVLGRRLLLKVVEKEGRPDVRRVNNKTLELQVRPGTDAEGRERVLYRWYRDLLRQHVPGLIDEWEARVGVSVEYWGVRRMKTKWGSCNPDQRRIWLNSELAKRPLTCLEYVLVHEMVHLIERKHDERFVALMEALMPSWRLRRDELNSGPLAHENWNY